MMFSPDLTALYVAVPKTGCTTIKAVVAACMGLVGPEILSGNSPSWIHQSWRGRDRKWSDLTDEERADMLFGENAFRFTSVRNPYERVVSCYLNKVADERAKHVLGRRVREVGDVTMLSFLKFVADQSPLQRDPHCRVMADLCISDKVSYHDIIRYESFEDDLRRIMEKLNVVDLPIPMPAETKRTHAGSHVHDLLGPEESALIRTIYERDFDGFGYSRDLSEVGRLL